MFVFGIVLLLVMTIMHVYVFKRAASLPLFKGRVLRKALMGTGVVLWLVFALDRFMGHGQTGAIASALEVIGMHWMGMLFLFGVAFLLVDIITGFGFLMRRHVFALRGLALIAGVCLSMAALVQGMRPPVVQNYEVQLPGLPPEMNGKVIIAMSDLHAGEIVGREWLAERVAQVQEQKPDMVVLLGDILEGHGHDHEELISVLHGLSAPLGVWVVLGNHEFYAGRHNGGVPLNFDGIRVLSNTWTEVSPGLVVAGVDDLTFNHRSGNGGDPVGKALSDRPPGATILLSHTPWYAEKIAKEGVGLMLSGHTHGGQIWPFGYLAKLVYPLFAGEYKVNGMTVIVCRGTGTWGPRMRLWNPGEILRVKLVGK